MSVSLAEGVCLSASLAFLDLAVTLLAEVLLGVSLAADPLRLFPSSFSLRASPESRRDSHWTVAFLFGKELTTTSGDTLEDGEGVKGSLSRLS